VLAETDTIGGDVIALEPPDDVSTFASLSVG
jgi:hypothetical protein